MLEQFVQYAELPIRIMTGIIMAYHGIPKLFTKEGYHAHLKLSESIGFKPGILWGTLSAIAECIGGIALILGAYTQYAALLIAINMLVATYAKKFVWHLPFTITKGGYEYDLLLIMACITIALLGAGPYAIDAVSHLPFA